MFVKKKFKYCNKKVKILLKLNFCYFPQVNQKNCTKLYKKDSRNHNYNKYRYNMIQYNF